MIETRLTHTHSYAIYKEKAIYLKKVHIIFNTYIYNLNLINRQPATTLIVCECCVSVNVGQGGISNLENHKAGESHKHAMEGKKYQSITNFFNKKPKYI